MNERGSKRGGYFEAEPGRVWGTIYIEGRKRRDLVLCSLLRLRI